MTHVAKKTALKNDDDDDDDNFPHGVLTKMFFYETYDENSFPKRCLHVSMSRLYEDEDGIPFSSLAAPDWLPLWDDSKCNINTSMIA